MTQMLERIDPEGWWVFVVCTGRRTHAAETLGVIFEHVDFREGVNGQMRGQLQWGPRSIYLNADGTRVRQLIHTPQMRADEETTSEEADLIRRLRGRGSLNFDCPEGCNWRIPRTKWDTMTEEARARRLETFDVSAYS